MVRKHREVASRTDYLLDSNQRTFLNVAVKEPHHNFDYFMVMG